MRAELVVMGKRVDMAARTNRRVLVALVYAGMAALMAGLWLLDGWRTSGVYLIFTTLFVNQFILGGYAFGGLIKPFNGKAPHQSDPQPPFLLLGLRVYQVPSEESEYRSDERELRQRDQAHYQAYQVLAPVLVVIWVLAAWKLHAPRLLAWIPASADAMLYGLVLAAVVVSVTLPQAILLWTEPDMEPEQAVS
jgi:hypothetical protein